MNVLIVDDDRFTVAALKEQMNWQALGISDVYTAANRSQAQNILLYNPVEILICDIEMPQGSGLELLAWIRDKKLSIQVIFITNYADFNYAQKAIELQSLEYCLKPVELDKLALIVKKAAERYRQEKLHEQESLNSRLWQENKHKLKELFWQKIITGKIFPSETSIEKSLIEFPVSYSTGEFFLPLLIRIFPNHSMFHSSKDKSIFEYALFNVLYELFGQFNVETISAYTNNFDWIMIIKTDRIAPEFAQIARTFIEKANMYLECDACISYDSTCRLHQVYQYIRSLIHATDDIADCRNQVTNVSGYTRQEYFYSPPNFPRLERYLNAGDGESFLQETDRYLKNLKKIRRLNTSILRILRLDIMQLIYSLLSQNEIQAHQLLSGEQNDQLYENSLSSAEDLQKYLQYLVNTLVNFQKSKNQTSDILARVKNYIKDHYNDELSRDKLAAMVNIHPDYLTRLFKKEYNISLVQYITETRMNAAKKILVSTDTPINIIYSLAGYTSYSHFCKVFRETCGCTPNKYRKKHKQLQVQPNLL